MKIARWAEKDGIDQLTVDLGPRATALIHSVATGEGLVTNGLLGVDLIRLDAGQGFVPHTHPGDHILIVIGGEGTITAEGAVHPTVAGSVYMVDGAAPHAVGARTEHVILAVGAPHKAVDDADRMAPVEYQTVVSHDYGDMTCLVCPTQPVARFPELLHDTGCLHCPCPFCVTTGEAELDARLHVDLTAARDAAA